MESVFSESGVTAYRGDCVDVMRSLPECSVHAIVTDPPYGLGFMGKEWDKLSHDWHCEWAKESLRVARPGATLLAFGGTRSHHRLMCAIEDAGWKIRDCLMWVYGTGFPKSLNVGKAVDKMAGDHPEWSGYGTALKPAWEPIVMAMKPLDGTFAENAMKHGVAGINIDECRVALNGDFKCGANGRPSQTGLGDNYDPATANQHSEEGRWPANLILDEESGSMLDEQSGISTSGAMKREVGSYDGESVTGLLRGSSGPHNQHGGTGGASRFFYCAKASKKERGGSKHPTVKPLELMRYLVRLVRPPKGGVILDPFGGSGTTAEACECVIIEKEESYVEDIKSRISRV